MQVYFWKKQKKRKKKKKKHFTHEKRDNTNAKAGIFWKKAQKKRKKIAMTNHGVGVNFPSFVGDRYAPVRFSCAQIFCRSHTPYLQNYS
jgi:hypothetical protein